MKFLIDILAFEGVELTTREGEEGVFIPFKRNNIKTYGRHINIAGYIRVFRPSSYRHTHQLVITLDNQQGKAIGIASPPSADLAWDKVEKLKPKKKFAKKIEKP